jgi:transketolase
MLDGLKSPNDMRVVFINTLIEEARHNKDIWLVIGDVGFGLVEPFQKEFSDRFINVGIAEQNMIGVSAGLAIEGKTVFCYSLGSFGSARCYEQIRLDVCYRNTNVKIISGGSGLIFGYLGTTHHATEDISIMRALPNMIVLAPCSAIESKIATKAMIETKFPCYMSLSRAGDNIVHQTFPSDKIWNGSSSILKNGFDKVTIMGCGGIMSEVVEAGKALEKDGIDVEVVDFLTVKPLDKYAVMHAAEKGMIFTVEEHNLDGGFGSAVAEVITDNNLSTRLVCIGIKNKFIEEVGTQAYLRKINGLDAEGIANRIKEVING